MIVFSYFLKNILKKRKKREKRGEVATVVGLISLVFIGAATLASSIFLTKNKTTSVKTKAQVMCTFNNRIFFRRNQGPTVVCDKQAIIRGTDSDPYDSWILTQNICSKNEDCGQGGWCYGSNNKRCLVRDPSCDNGRCFSQENDSSQQPTQQPSNQPTQQQSQQPPPNQSGSCPGVNIQRGPCTSVVSAGQCAYRTFDVRDQNFSDQWVYCCADGNWYAKSEIAGILKHLGWQSKEECERAGIPTPTPIINRPESPRQPGAQTTITNQITPSPGDPGGKCIAIAPETDFQRRKYGCRNNNFVCSDNTPNGICVTPSPRPPGGVTSNPPPTNPPGRETSAQPKTTTVSPVAPTSTNKPTPNPIPTVPTLKILELVTPTAPVIRSSNTINLTPPGIPPIVPPPGTAGGECIRINQDNFVMLPYQCYPSLVCSNPINGGICVTPSPTPTLLTETGVLTNPGELIIENITSDKTLKLSVVALQAFLFNNYEVISVTLLPRQSYKYNYSGFCTSFRRSLSGNIIYYSSENYKYKSISLSCDTYLLIGID